MSGSPRTGCVASFRSESHLVPYERRCVDAYIETSTHCRGPSTADAVGVFWYWPESCPARRDKPFLMRQNHFIRNEKSFKIIPSVALLNGCFHTVLSVGSRGVPSPNTCCTGILNHASQLSLLVEWTQKTNKLFDWIVRQSNVQPP